MSDPAPSSTTRPLGAGRVWQRVRLVLAGVVALGWFGLTLWNTTAGLSLLLLVPSSQPHSYYSERGSAGNVSAESMSFVFHQCSLPTAGNQSRCQLMPRFDTLDLDS